jgi:elongation factor P
MAEQVSTNQFKNGMHIDVDGTIYRIVEFQHVKPGKGGAFVRTKLKAFETGAVVDRTFRAGEKFPRILTAVADMQFLYDDGTEVVMMDTETYEQVSLPRSLCADDLRWIKEGDTVQLLSVDDRPATLQLPASVELAVAATEPGIKGDTVSNVTKPATLETGAVVQVPLFVNEGDTVKVDTREGTYISRA